MKISKKVFIISFFSLLGVFLIASILLLGRFGVPVKQIGGYDLPLRSLQGTLSSLVMLVCIVLVFADYFYGSILGFILLFINFLIIVVSIFVTKSFYNLAALSSMLISFGSLSIIVNSYHKSFHSSNHDLLTGLKNRRAFFDEVTSMHEMRKNFRIVAIEFMNFKNINTTYGLHAGDGIFKTLSNHIKSCAGKNNMIYRMTGAVLFVVYDEKTDVFKEINKIKAIEQKPVVFEEIDPTGQKKIVSCKVQLAFGVSSSSVESSEYVLMLNHADTALTYARKKEDDHICFYDGKLEDAERKQKEAEELVSESLEKKYFYLVYQPQFTLEGKALRGFETLIRCRKPDGSIVSPGVFIPAAEKSNLILKLDDYVIQRALTEAKKIVDSHNKSIVISVNVSAKNIATAGFAEKVLEMIKQSDFPAECLEIEITEYSLADSLEITRQNVNKLREAGVQIALDDFGTGYTSISQVVNLPVNLLKIDKSLIDDVVQSIKKRRIVDTIVNMGHIMDCEVISEGVETENQLSVLRELDCDFIQGFVWSKPIEYEDAVELSKNSK